VAGSGLKTIRGFKKFQQSRAVALQQLSVSKFIKYNGKN
jgi:hypothetical protein